MVTQSLAGRKPPAVGTVLDERSDTPIGTAFAVCPTLALTAFHNVGDRENAADHLEYCRLTFGGQKRLGKIGSFDSRLDIAVLRLEVPLPDNFQFITLTTEVAQTTAYSSTGIVVALADTIPMFTADGHVSNPTAYILDGVPAIQLYCRQAVSVNMSGMSGAPVIVQLVDGSEAAVGIIRWNPENVHGIAQGNTIFASPVREILAAFADELEEFVRAAAIEQRGFCLCHSNEDRDLAVWVCDSLEGRGVKVLARGLYVRPGHNYIAKISEAHSTYSDKIVLVTRDLLSKASPAHTYELQKLQELVRQGPSARIVPIRLGGSELPEFLADFEPIDLTSCDHNAAAELLLEGLLPDRSLVPAMFPPRLDGYRLPTEVSRSRLPEVTLRTDSLTEGSSGTGTGRGSSSPAGPPAPRSAGDAAGQSDRRPESNARGGTARTRHDR